MANQRVSELIQRTPDGTEFLEVIIPPFTPGTNRKVLLQDLIDLVGDEHFRGAYVSLVALQTAVPVGIVGDYADVDTGIGSNAVRYIWDDDDNAWIAGGSVVPDADATTKGIARLYPSTSLGANTDGAPTQNAVKTYVDNILPSDFVTLTDGATVTWDLDNKPLPLAKLTSTQSFTIDMTNVASGARGVFKLITDTASAIVMTFDASFTNKTLNATFSNYTFPALTAQEYFLSFVVEGSTIEWVIGDLASITNARPEVEVQRVANQSIANNTVTAFSFDTEIVDNDNLWTITPNPTRLVVPGSGNKTVIIFASVTFALNTAGTRRLWFYKNGAIQVGGVYQAAPVTGIETTLSGTYIKNCVGGDYFEILPYQNSGGALNCVGAGTMIVFDR